MKRKIFILLFHIFCMLNCLLVTYVGSNLNLLYEVFLNSNLEVSFLIEYRNLLYLVAALIIISNVIFSFLVSFNTKETK